jgi:hypothetical protein
VGLVARELERRGIATVCLSSAWSITAAVNPPRAVFVDFPLGRTAGKRGDKRLQRHIMKAALAAIDESEEPGTIRALRVRWSADERWKDTAMRPAQGGGAATRDDRVTRHAEPQYQYPEDKDAAEARLRQAEPHLRDL